MANSPIVATSVVQHQDVEPMPGMIIKDNMDIDGDNLASKPGQFSDCCNFCQVTQGCVAYAWNDYQGGTCWLKSANGPIRKNNGVKIGFLNSGSSDYRLKKSYEGNNFFDAFDFWTNGDPTHGFVDYVDRPTAERTGLISIINGKVKISADSDNQIPHGKRGRPSIRIHSKDSYNEGLFLFDIDHMPTGPGTWPAYWLVGDNWPNNGEADILEGVGGDNFNHFALHTKNGCRMPEQDQSLFTGKWATGKNGRPATNCYVYESAQWDNQGCSISSPDGFFGDEFNSGQGGVFAFEWDRGGYMRTWIFKRNQIPSDILQSNPNPSNWGKPIAYFKLGENCTPSHFNAMKIIINLTFCGDWAGHVYPGGMSACIDKVRNNPEAYKNAYWLINYVKVFDH
uniref:GH16 domain-containing protein n=1 Tax=Acrobeloides nanus TaxID=290746 RepID=A0A914CL67_9BILA